MDSAHSPAAAAILISIPALARQGVVPVVALGQLSDGTPQRQDHLRLDAASHCPDAT